MKASSKRSNNLQGTVTCPGDKSISQRSVIIGSLLDEDIQICGFLFAEDPLSTIGAPMVDKGSSANRNPHI